MKTKKFEKKLSLNKKTIADLEAGEQNAVKGGFGGTGRSFCWCYPSLPTCTCPYTGVPVCLLCGGGEPI